MNRKKTNGPTLERILTVLGVSLLAAIVLEVCTLFGAYAKSPLVLSDWEPVRMAFFFALAACCTIIAICRSKTEKPSVRERSLRLADTARTFALSNARQLAIIVAFAVVAFLLSPLLTGAWDMRYGLLCLVVGLAGYLLIFKRSFFTARPERYFALLAMSFGILVCFFTPVYADISWDGVTHFSRAQALSYLVNPEYDGADVLMAEMPSHGWQLMLRSDADEVNPITIESLDFPIISTVNQTLDDAAKNGEVKNVRGFRTIGGEPLAQTSMIGYFPLSVGLWTGRLLHLPPVARYTLARLVHLVTYCLIIYYAIKRIRYGKLIIAVFSLFPTMVSMACNFSYDPMCVALTIYSFARFFGILQSDSEQLNTIDAVAIFGTFLGGAFVKAILFPMLLVFLCAPKDRFGQSLSRRKWLLCTVGTAMVLMLSFVLPFVISSGASNSDTRGGGNISPVDQVKYIIFHPLAYTKTLIEFLEVYLSVSNLSHELGFLAPYLIPDDTPIRYVISGVQYLLLLLVALFDRGSSRASTKSAILTLVGDALSLILICTALYVSFTGVGVNRIAGVQTRYVYPLVVPTLITCINFPLSDSLDPQRRTGFALGAQALILVVVLTFVYVLRF